MIDEALPVVDASLRVAAESFHWEGESLPAEGSPPAGDEQAEDEEAEDRGDEDSGDEEPEDAEDGEDGEDGEDAEDAEDEVSGGEDADDSGDETGEDGEFEDSEDEEVEGEDDGTEVSGEEEAEGSGDEAAEAGDAEDEDAADAEDEAEGREYSGEEEVRCGAEDGEVTGDEEREGAAAEGEAGTGKPPEPGAEADGELTTAGRRPGGGGVTEAEAGSRIAEPSDRLARAGVGAGVTTAVPRTARRGPINRAARLKTLLVAVSYPSRYASSRSRTVRYHWCRRPAAYPTQAVNAASSVMRSASFPGAVMVRLSPRYRPLAIARSTYPDRSTIVGNVAQPTPQFGLVGAPAEGAPDVCAGRPIAPARGADGQLRTRQAVDRRLRARRGADRRSGMRRGADPGSGQDRAQAADSTT